MHKQKVTLNALTLIGLTVRTNNRNELRPASAKIASQVYYYWRGEVANRIKHRANPGVTYAVYTDYASDEHGDYTYFIGEVVDSLENQDLTEFKALSIPQSDYQKFTTAPGKIPQIVFTAWQQIWAMSNHKLEGKRRYVADFEIYDSKAAYSNSAIVDIYLGVVAIENG